MLLPGSPNSNKPLISVTVNPPFGTPTTFAKVEFVIETQPKVLNTTGFRVSPALSRVGNTTASACVTVWEWLVIFKKHRISMIEIYPNLTRTFVTCG
jgi:hypothetical protein